MSAGCLPHLSAQGSHHPSGYTDICLDILDRELSSLAPQMTLVPWCMGHTMGPGMPLHKVTEPPPWASNATFLPMACQWMDDLHQCQAFWHSRHHIKGHWYKHRLCCSSGWHGSSQTRQPCMNEGPPGPERRQVGVGTDACCEHRGSLGSHTQRGRACEGGPEYRTDGAS